MGLLGFGSREEEEEVEGKGGKKLINFPPGHPIRGRRRSRLFNPFPALSHSRLAVCASAILSAMCPSRRLCSL